MSPEQYLLPVADRRCTDKKPCAVVHRYTHGTGEKSSPGSGFAGIAGLRLWFCPPHLLGFMVSDVGKGNGCMGKEKSIIMIDYF